MLSATLTLLVVGAATLQQGAAPARATRGIVRAVSAGRADSIAAALRRPAAADDSLAVLRLATFARLRYRYAEAADHLATLIPPGGVPRSPVEFEALLEEARLFKDQSREGMSDTLTTLAVSLAGDWNRPDLEAQALVERGERQTNYALAPRAAADLRRAVTLAPDDPWLVANAHCALADQILLTRAFEASVEEATIGYDQAVAAGHDRAAALCRYVYARIKLPAGQFDSATIILGEVAERSRGTGDLALVARAEYLRAHLLGLLGQYGQGRMAAREALEQASHTKNTYIAMRASLNLARSALHFGDLPAARYYAKITDSLVAIMPDPLVSTTLRAAQGSMARALGDLGTAEARYREALAVAEGMGPPWPAYQHRALAAIAREVGDFTGAAALLDSARANARLADMGSWIADLQYDDAGVDLERGAPGSAERTLRRLLGDLATAAFSRRFPALVRLAQARLLQGDTADAEGILQAASDSFDLWRASLEDRDLRTHVYELREGDLTPDRGVPILLAGLVAGGRAPAAFEIAEHRRARELLEESVLLEATRPAPRAVADARGADRPHAWRDIADAIPDPSTAIVEFVAAPGARHTIAFVVTRDTVTGLLLPPIDSLAPAMARLTALIEDEAPVAGPAGDLGSALLAPILAVLPAGSTHLVVIPDGDLHRLPFDALVVNGRYLLEDYSISLAPSAELIARQWRAAPITGAAKILALGDPRIPGPGRTPAYAGVPDLQRLRGTAGESRRVARYADGEVWLGDAASETRLKTTALAGYRVLHFATHAIVDPSVAERNALILAAGEADDGYLHPDEVAELRLNADLVVLSACRTAGGVILRGEGVQGLTTPFLRAGARAVVATLWPIGDQATPALVRAFYDHLAEGLSSGDALRAAKAERLRAGAPVREWAAFIVTGDPSGTVPLTAPPPRRRGVYVLGGAALLALVYGLWRSRKGRRVDAA